MKNFSVAILTFVFVGCVIGAIGCNSGSPADKYATDPVALKRAKSVFVGTCSGYCHSSLPGLRDAPYLFDCVWLHGGSDEQIFDTITNGVPDTRMVSFGGKLPEGDDDIWRIISYLKSERTPC